MNELIRQVFNFNNSSQNTALRNPYLLTYSINSNRSGWGLRLGAGYNYQSLTTDDGISRRTTKVNDLQTRLGIEKSFMLSPKWSAGAGLDGVFFRNDSKTNTLTRSFDSVRTATTTKINSYGGGGMAWLRYHLTPHVLIGTEASFYYLTGKNESEITITRTRFIGSQGTIEETSTSLIDEKQSEGQLSIPVAFYLIVKF